jgi:hypothetical protein
MLRHIDTLLVGIERLGAAAILSLAFPAAAPEPRTKVIEARAELASFHQFLTKPREALDSVRVAPQ